MNEQKTAFTATGLVSDQTHAVEILTEIHPEGLSIRVSSSVAHRFVIPLRRRGADTDRTVIRKRCAKHPVVF
jgi:hypothetical protein